MKYFLVVGIIYTRNTEAFVVVNGEKELIVSTRIERVFLIRKCL